MVWQQGTHLGTEAGGGAGGLGSQDEPCLQPVGTTQQPQEGGRHSPLQGGQAHQDRASSCHIPGAPSRPLVCVCHPHTTQPAPYTPLTPRTFWNDCVSPWVTGRTVDSWRHQSADLSCFSAFEKHESNIDAQET